jgi:hypothetical protein
MLFVHGLGAPEHLTHGDTGGTHQPGNSGRQAGRVGRRGGGCADEGRRVFGTVGGTVARPVSELVGGRTARIDEQRAHLPETGIDEMLSIVDPAPVGQASAAGKGRSSHQTRRPYIAVDAALVAETVGEPGLPEELVEFAPVLLGDLLADVGGLVPGVRCRLVLARYGDPDGS